MHLEELSTLHCHLTTSEYTALTSWLPEQREDHLSQMKAETDCLEASVPATEEALITCCAEEAASGKPSARRELERVHLPVE